MEKDKSAVLAHRLNNMPNIYKIEADGPVRNRADHTIVFLTDRHNAFVDYIRELQQIVVQLFNEVSQI